MLKIFPVLILALLLFQCGKKRQNPRPIPQPTPVSTPTPSPSPSIQPTPTPVSSPTPSPVSFATPYPTPNINPLAYLPKLTAGKTVTVSGENLADKIQAAQNDPEVGTVKIEGGGSIAKQVTLRKHTVFDSSTYSIDVQGITDQGAFLVADGVLVEGTWRPPQILIDYFEKGDGRNPNDPYLLKVHALTAEQLAGAGTTLLEPTFVRGPFPAIEVFQALGDTTNSHTDKARDIAVMGFRIKGRQRVYDGGVRSTILFGNCTRCAALYNYLEDTGSIGILFGGSGLQRNNFANDVVMWRNVLSGVAAANMATINTENSYTFENYVRRPGHHDPRFGGGVCGYDHETNSPADHTRNINVYNNLFDYEDAMQEGAGNAICLQDPYVGANRGHVVAANNVIIGGRMDNVHRYMSNGFFLVGLNSFEVINNYIFRTGQNAIQAYNISKGLIQDNIFDSTGGGGAVSFWSNAMRDTVIRRNNSIVRQGLTINMASGFIEVCGSGNVYEDNMSPGHAVGLQPVRQCP